MKLDNQTPFHAHLFRSAIDKQRMLGSLLVRVTYDIVGDRLRIARDQPWKVSGPPWDGPYGPMPSDELFYRGGVDVFVLGSARPPGGRTAPRVEVDVRVGSQFRHRVVVFGDRVWEKRGGKLVASAPRPFRALPLVLANSFGGSDEWDELPVPYTDNPEGKGYYLEEANAVGRPLPNIEDPDALVTAWNSAPEPVGVGFTPIVFGPRLRRWFEVDEEKRQIKKIHPQLFNHAFPRMVAAEAKPGDRVSVTGVREDGPLVFHLPEAPVRTRISLGSEVHTRGLPIEQIGAEPDAMRVFISFRYPFRYTMVPLQKRSCELLPAA